MLAKRHNGARHPPLHNWEHAVDELGGNSAALPEFTGPARDVYA